LRSFPVNNIISQSNIVINGAGGFVTQTDEVTYVMKRFIKTTEGRYYQTPTTTDAHPDFVHSYGQLANHTTGNGIGDPFAGYTADGYGNLNEQELTATCADGLYVPRGQFPSAIGSAATEIVYVCTEGLMNGVLGQAGDEEGFVNVTKLDVTLTFATILSSAVWSSFQGLNLASNVALDNGGINTPTVTITSCELLCHFITPSVTSIPSVFTTDFKQYVLNSQANNADIPITTSELVLTSSANLSFNNLTLNTVPEFLYIYVRPPRPHATTTGEVVARIQKISINLGTSFGHLSQLDEQTLYLMTKDNGYKGRGFSDWIRTGSFLCIDCAKDLGLVPGQNRYLPIDFTIDVAFPKFMPVFPATGGSYSAGSCTINLLAVVPGAVSIEPDRCTSILGFSSIEQSNAMADDSITETNLVKDMGAQGAGLGAHGGRLNWNGVWKVVKTGMKVAKPVLSLAGKATGNPMLSMASDGLGVASDLVGDGYHRRKRGRGMLLG
jgi:hypothetical protein